MSIKSEHVIIGALAAGVLGYIALQEYQSRPALKGGAQRHVTGTAVRGAALDVSLGQVTPDHLLWFGPTFRPPGWVPHRVKYNPYPGQNLEILMHGAPGSCPVAVPPEDRVWMFNPPAEVDL